jgi:hypothetical protein
MAASFKNRTNGKSKDTKAKKKKRNLVTQMKDFRASDGSWTLSLVSDVPGVDDMFLTNVSMYRDGHVNHYPIHTPLLDFTRKYVKDTSVFDLTTIQLTLKGGWSDLFEQPDDLKEAQTFFHLDDLKSTLEEQEAREDEDDDDDDITSTMQKLKEGQSKAKLGNMKITGYLNIYIIYDNVEHLLKKLPMGRGDKWERVMRSYLAYRLAKDSKCTFADVLEEFTLVVSDVRKSTKISVKNVMSKF